MPSDKIPYPLFSLSALVPWTLFVNGLTQASNSLVGAQNLVKRVYFPRMVMPMSNVFAGLVDFFIAFVILLFVIVYYLFIEHAPGITISANVLWLPLFLVLALSTSLGVSLWLSALNVEYRDVRYVVPFLTQLWMYATPIVYPASIVPEPWRTLIGINPMAGVVEGFRWALLGTATRPGPMVWASAAVSLLLLVGGAYYFRRMERNFADVV
jgi:lipopolysaccharide transport system permease protein